MFEGIFTALITPFKDGKVDESALWNLVEQQIEAGIAGLVPCGSTGESATLSADEHNDVIDIVISAAAGRVPGTAGAGSILALVRIRRFTRALSCRHTPH